MIWPGNAAHLRLVPHSPHRQPDELAVGRAGDRFSQRGLADAGRAGKGEDSSLGFPDERADREELENAILDLFQPVVVLVQDVLCLLEIPALP
jgi:hypothetical protein